MMAMACNTPSSPIIQSVILVAGLEPREGSALSPWTANCEIDAGV